MRDLVEKVATGNGTQYDLEEMKHLGKIMKQASHCGLGLTAPNPVLGSLDKFPEIWTEKLKSKDFEPAFDLDGALSEARALTGRDDVHAHIA